jgi:thiol-disulfide isomerase/thioredoxin
MRKQILFVITFLLLAFTTTQVFAKSEVYDIYGKAHDVASLKNKWIVINYWADWCHVCIEEIPELNKLVALTKNKPVVLFAVNYDKLPDHSQQEFAQHYQINYMMLRDNPFNDRFPHEQITSLPVTYVISPNGHVQEINGQLHVNDIMDMVG